MITPGQLLRSKRSEAGLSLRAVAENGAGSYGYLLELENDKKCPSLRTLYKIAKAIGCETVDLIPPEEDLKIFFAS